MVGFVALKSLEKTIVKPVAIAVGILVTQRCLSAVLRAVAEEAKATAKDGEEAQDDDQEEESKPIMTQAMVATIGVYKNFISPLLPPACRFFPTCSQYGVQAIQEFGPTKGSILTGWRLLRCSPFGGKGYDPPKWPPVFYTYGSY
jgi:putative membrane protein insertion efficiency factor